MHDNDTNTDSAPPAVRHLVLDSTSAVADDDGQPWLGCEGLHPLTWLPTPAPAGPGMPDSD